MKKRLQITWQLILQRT